MVEAQVKLLQPLQLINATLVQRSDPVLAEIQHDQIDECAEAVHCGRHKANHVV